jgi:nicotinamidase-related amidase
MKKIVILILLLAQVFGVSRAAQKADTEKADTIKTALLIVDIQNFYFPGDGPGLVNVHQAAIAAGKVLKVFRDRNLTVVHVRHQASKGFEIHSSVEPLSGEKVITKKEVNSFQGTDLLEYLKQNKITRLVVIGMQTHMCLEAAVRAGHDFGFQCIVVKDACATKDLKFDGKVIAADDVHNSTFATLTAGGYSKVISLEEFTNEPDKYITK